MRMGRSAPTASHLDIAANLQASGCLHHDFVLACISLVMHPWAWGKHGQPQGEHTPHQSLELRACPVPKDCRRAQCQAQAHLPPAPQARCPLRSQQCSTQTGRGGSSGCQTCIHLQVIANHVDKIAATWCVMGQAADIRAGLPSSGDWHMISAAMAW